MARMIVMKTEEEASTSVMEMKMTHSPKLVQGTPLSLSLSPSEVTNMGLV